MRGRNRPKGPNPLTRSYESNGPDVKIRGTAQHIADKYAQLARDALASGDPIAAENYFQHGEHYFRIITGAAQEQGRPQASQGYARNGFDEDEDGDEEGVQGASEGGRNGFGYGADEYGDPTQAPQPFERHDFDARRQDRTNDRNDRGPQRFQGRDRNDRNDRGQRFDGNRPDYGRSGEPRQDFRGERQDRHQDRGERNDRGRQESRQDFRQDYRPDYGQQDGGRPEPGRREFRQDRQDRQDRFENGRFESGRGDHDAPRQESQRNEAGRSEAARQDAPRSEAPRQEPVRQESLRQEPRGQEPRADGPVRPDAPPRRGRRAEPRAEVADQSAFPAFLMTATRNPPPAAPADEAEALRPAPSRETLPAAEAAPASAADEAPAPKPRRRRTRYKGAEGEPAPEPTDTPNAAE